MYSGVVYSDCERARQEIEVNCDENPDHPFCDGKRGQDGLIFCSLKPEGLVRSFYDDLDFDDENDPLIHCATDPETKEECELTDSQREALQGIFRSTLHKKFFCFIFGHVCHCRYIPYLSKKELK